MNELQRKTMAPTETHQAPVTSSMERPRYEPPSVVTLTDRQLLAELGPAQMGGYFNPFDDMFQEGIP